MTIVLTCFKSTFVGWFFNFLMWHHFKEFFNVNLNYNFDYLLLIMNVFCVQLFENKPILKLNYIVFNHFSDLKLWALDVPDSCLLKLDIKCVLLANLVELLKTLMDTAEKSKGNEKYSHHPNPWQFRFSYGENMSCLKRSSFWEITQKQDWNSSNVY